MSTLVEAPAPRLQRAEGRGFASVRLREARTRLVRLHQSGCLKLRFPRVHEGGRVDAVLINSSGGLTGGDRIVQGFEVEDGAALQITTQSCERVYRALQPGRGDGPGASDMVASPDRHATRVGDRHADRSAFAGGAQVATTFQVGAGASLAYLPQETILFDGGRVARTLDVACAASSRLLVAESVILGRQTMGETVVSGSFRDRWRVRRDGRLVFADNLDLSGGIAALAARPACLAGGRAFSTVLCQMPEPERLVDEIRGLIGDGGGASAFEGLILVRLVAETGFALRKRLIPVLSALASDPLPRLWSI